MLQEMLTNHVVMYTTLVLGGIGIITKFLLGMKYSILLKHTSRIGNEKTEWIELLKKKFELCHKLEMNVHNVDKFVDKYVYRQKFCGIFLYTWENICGKLCVLSGALSVISVVLALYIKCGQAVITEYITAGIFSITLLITFSILANVSKKKDTIHLLLCEYLENVYGVRLKAEKENPELFKQYKAEMKKLEDAGKKKKVKKVKSKKDSQREEIERMKQELVAELKQERLENEKKRLLEKQQEEKRKEAKEAVESKEEVKAAQKEEKPKEKQLEKKVKTEKEDNEKILQDILREYLGEING